LRPFDNTSRKYGRPNGVVFALKVSGYVIEPTELDSFWYLLAKDDWRAALADETKPLRPQMSVVFCGLTLSGFAEWLAGATSGPHGLIIWPYGEPECVRPPADACEEVALRVPLEVGGLDIDDGSLVNVAGRDMAFRDEVAEPLRGIWVDLVVVGTQPLAPVGVKRISREH